LTDLPRLALLPYFSAADTAHVALERLVPRQISTVDERALDLAIDWLCLTHDVTGRQGSSKGFSLIFGWQPPFPETSGYIIGTFLRYATRNARGDVAARAHEIGEWEVAIQGADGGIMEGLLTDRPKPSTVFNTGMVMHGWLDLHDAGETSFLAPAIRGARFLLDNQDEDGAWRGEAEYFRIPHTYNSRVSWALLRLAAAAGDEGYASAATRQLDWVLRQQTENGWFRACAFKPGMSPSTHSIAYTLRGLLESYELSRRSEYLDAVERTCDVLIRKLEAKSGLPAAFHPDWTPAARYECLTGTVQLGGVWLRLYQVNGDVRYLNAGLKAIDRAASHQSRIPWRPVKGALPGSYPIYGRYAPLQFPNWATKFLADGLMLRDDALKELA
jgi:Squalene-hopene cyclase C-terminal domain